MTVLDFTIKCVHGHYEVYTKSGQFVLSDDTYETARNSLIEELSQQ